MQLTLDDVRPTRELEPPRRRRRRKKPVSLAPAALTAILFAAALVLVSGRDAPSDAPAPALPALPPSEWSEIPEPAPVFGLSAPEFVQDAKTYTARRHRGGGRQDLLTFGQPDGHGPYLRLTLDRAGAEPVSDVSFFVALVRLSAAADLAITRSENPTLVATRFGPLEVAGVDLAAADGVAKACLGFRGTWLAGRFRIGGLACGAPARPVSAPTLACLLGRLRYDGSDTALADFFARSARNRAPQCADDEPGPAVAAPSWIDGHDAPPLRLRRAR